MSPKRKKPLHPDDVRMSLGDHVEELRRYLIRALIGICVALLFAFYFGFSIITWLAMPLLQAQKAYGLAPQTITLDPTAGFTTVYLPVCLITAVIAASPWIIYQIWQFVVLGLYEHERRVVYLLTPFSTIMTALGVGFTYYIMLPVCLMFFIRFSTYYPDLGDIGKSPINFVMPAETPGSKSLGDAPTGEAALLFPVLDDTPENPREGMVWIDRGDVQIKCYLGGTVRVLALNPNRLLAPQFALGQFVRFAAFMTLGIVAAFQTPVIMLVLGWTQLFDPKELGKMRRYAFFVCLVVGAVLTPTDPLSMTVLALPLYLLFEFGLFLMRWVYEEPEWDDT